MKRTLSFGYFAKAATKVHIYRNILAIAREVLSMCCLPEPQIKRHHPSPVIFIGIRSQNINGCSRAFMNYSEICSFLIKTKRHEYFHKVFSGTG